MLKKYTKYVATAFAVASLSTFMIGCGGEEEEYTGPPVEGDGDEPDTEGAGATNDTAPPLDGE
jgi:hypothetical protein